MIHHYWCRFRLRKINKDEIDQTYALVAPFTSDDGYSVENEFVAIDYLDSNFSTKTYTQEDSEEIVSNLNKICMKND